MLDHRLLETSCQMSISTVYCFGCFMCVSTKNVSSEFSSHLQCSKHLFVFELTDLHLLGFSLALALQNVFTILRAF